MEKDGIRAAEVWPRVQTGSPDGERVRVRTLAKRPGVDVVTRQRWRTL